MPKKKQRELLAEERTLLAKERTIMANMRTMLAIIGAALLIIKLVTDIPFWPIALVLLILAGIIIVERMYKYYKVKKLEKKIAKKTKAKIV